MKKWIIQEFANRQKDTILLEFLKEHVPSAFEKSEIAEMRRQILESAIEKGLRRIPPEADSTYFYIIKLEEALQSHSSGSEEFKFLKRELVRCFDKKCLTFKRDGTLNLSYEYPKNKQFLTLITQAGLVERNEFTIARKERKFSISEAEVEELEQAGTIELRRDQDPGVKLTDPASLRYVQLIELFGLDYRKLIGAELNYLDGSGSFSKK